MVTDVGTPGLPVNVAVPSGTVSELQLVAWVHSSGDGGAPPFQVPSVACATPGLSAASAPNQTLPSIAARLSAAGGDVVAIRIALSRIASPGAAGAAARVACERRRYERIPQPLRARTPRIPIIARAVPRGQTIAPRLTLRAEPVTINSRSSVSARIAAGCGFLATRAA